MHKFSVMNYKAHNVPVFSEVNNKEWVEYGDKDLYPYYLEDLYASSSVHAAVVKGTADMIYGTGLTSVFKDAHVDQWLHLIELVGDGECLRRLAFDIKLFGHGYLNVIWSKDRSRPVQLHHVPTQTIRAEIPENEDEVSMYWYHENWPEVRQSGVEPKAMPAFSNSDREVPSQLLHIKTYSPMGYVYSTPDYLGCTNYVELDRDISELHLNSVKTGLLPSFMLSFNNGVPSDEERIQLEQAVYDKFGGAKNAGKIMITYNDNKDDAPVIEPFNIPDVHKQFDFLAKQCFQEILSGHRVTSPLLFGLRSEGGGFGSNADEMRDAYELYLNTVVQPMQDVIVDALRPVFSACNITLQLEFGRLVPASFLYTEDVSNIDQMEKDASYNGAQIASAVDVMTKVKEGIITEEQAKVFLVQMLQFSPEVANALFEVGVSAIGVVEDEEAEVTQEEVQLKKKVDTTVLPVLRPLREKYG